MTEDILTRLRIPHPSEHTQALLGEAADKIEELLTKLEDAEFWIKELN